MGADDPLGGERWEGQQQHEDAGHDVAIEMEGMRLEREGKPEHERIESARRNGIEPVAGEEGLAVMIGLPGATLSAHQKQGGGDGGDAEHGGEGDEDFGGLIGQRRAMAEQDALAEFETKEHGQKSGGETDDGLENEFAVGIGFCAVLQKTGNLAQQGQRREGRGQCRRGLIDIRSFES